MQCIKIVVTAAGNMKLLAIATTYMLSSTQMYLQFPTGSGLPVAAIYNPSVGLIWISIGRCALPSD